MTWSRVVLLFLIFIVIRVCHVWFSTCIVFIFIPIGIMVDWYIYILFLAVLGVEWFFLWVLLVWVKKRTVDSSFC